MLKKIILQSAGFSSNCWFPLTVFRETGGGITGASLPTILMQEGWPAHDVIRDVRILVPGNVIEPASQSQNITTRDDLTPRTLSDRERRE